MEWIRTLLLAMAVGALCFGVFDLHETAKASQTLIAKATLVAENVDRLTIITGAAMTSVQKGAKQWEIASKEQASSTTLAMQNVNVVAVRAGALVSQMES